MMRRNPVIFAIVLIAVLASIVLLVSKFIQPLLPPDVNSNLVFVVAVIVGVAAFLASFDSIVNLIERVFRVKFQSRRKFDVYLSFSNSDIADVRIIQNHLQAQGITSWLFDDQVLSGSEFEAEMLKGIKDSTTFACLVGVRGVTQWQGRELEWAHSRQLPIIPVLLPGIQFSSIANEELLKSRFAVQFHTLRDSNALNKLAGGIRDRKG